MFPTNSEFDSTICSQIVREAMWCITVETPWLTSVFRHDPADTPAQRQSPEPSFICFPHSCPPRLGGHICHPSILILALSNTNRPFKPYPYIHPKTQYQPKLYNHYARQHFWYSFKPHLLRALYMLKRRGQRPVPTSNCDWYMVDLAFEMTESLDNIPQTQLWLRWFLFLCLSHSAHMLHKPMRHCTLTANPSHLIRSLTVHPATRPR